MLLLIGFFLVLFGSLGMGSSLDRQVDDPRRWFSFVGGSFCLLLGCGILFLRVSLP